MKYILMLIQFKSLFHKLDEVQFHLCLRCKMSFINRRSTRKRIGFRKMLLGAKWLTSRGLVSPLSRMQSHSTTINIKAAK